MADARQNENKNQNENGKLNEIKGGFFFCTTISFPTHFSLALAKIILIKIDNSYNSIIRFAISNYNP
jgi:hypothetical protein